MVLVLLQTNWLMTDESVSEFPILSLGNHHTVLIIIALPSVLKSESKTAPVFFLSQEELIKKNLW